jgi:hypothetical protein
VGRKDVTYFTLHAYGKPSHPRAPPCGKEYDASESCIKVYRQKKELMWQSSGSWRNFCGQKAKYPKIEEKHGEYVSQK